MFQDKKIMWKGVVFVLILAGVLIFLVKNSNNNKDYSVVYMITGEVYVGKLSTFPDFALSDSYQLQVVKDTTDPTKNSFQLNPTKDAIWAPERMNITRRNIVFYGPLSSESQIAKKLAEQKK